MELKSIETGRSLLAKAVVNTGRKSKKQPSSSSVSVSFASRDTSGQPLRARAVAAGLGTRCCLSGLVENQVCSGSDLVAPCKRPVRVFRFVKSALSAAAVQTPHPQQDLLWVRGCPVRAPAGMAVPGAQGRGCPSSSSLGVKHGSCRAASGQFLCKRLCRCTGAGCRHPVAFLGGPGVHWSLAPRSIAPRAALCHPGAGCHGNKPRYCEINSWTFWPSFCRTNLAGMRGN